MPQPLRLGVLRIVQGPGPLGPWQDITAQRVRTLVPTTGVDALYTDTINLAAGNYFRLATTATVRDLAIKELRAPAIGQAGCPLPGQAALPQGTVLVYNPGTDPLPIGAGVQLSLNGRPFDTLSIPLPIRVQGFQRLAFTVPGFAVGTAQRLQARLLYRADLNPTNDTATVTIRTRAYPLPWVQRFDTCRRPPMWTFDSSIFQTYTPVSGWRYLPGRAVASSIRPEVSIQGPTQTPYLEIRTSVDGALHLGRYGPLTDSARLGLRIDAEFFTRVRDSVRIEASFDCGATWQRMVALGTGAFSTDQSSDSLRKLRFYPLAGLMAARPPGSSDTAMVRIAPRLLQSNFATIRLQELRLEPGNRITAALIPQAPHTLRVHPNPTQGTVSLSPEPAAPTPCQVQDNLGRTIWTGLYQPGRPLDLRHLPPGAYLLRTQGPMPRQGRFVRQ